MNAALQLRKLDLIQWLSTVNEISTLEKVDAIRQKDIADWWDNISMAEKESIEKGLADAESGKLKPHTEAQKIYGKWLRN